MTKMGLWILLAALVVGPSAVFAQPGGVKLTEEQKKSMQQMQQMNANKYGGMQTDTSVKNQQMQMWKERQEAERARQQRVKDAQSVVRTPSQGQPAQSQNAKKPNPYQMNQMILGR